MTEAARTVDAAVQASIHAGHFTYDLGGDMKCSAVGQKVVAAIKDL